VAVLSRSAQRRRAASELRLAIRVSGESSALVKKDAHLGWGERTPRGVLQNGASLFERYPREPFHEL
jgi:hypothetical protein